MIWIIAAVVAALVMLVLMSKRAETDDDPVWQTVLEVDRLADEIARWETNLWSLWVMAVLENLLFRLDKSERIYYLDKIHSQVTELEFIEFKDLSMSEKDALFPYYSEKPDDLMTYKG